MSDSFCSGLTYGMLLGLALSVAIMMAACSSGADLADSRPYKVKAIEMDGVCVYYSASLPDWPTAKTARGLWYPDEASAARAGCLAAR
jgi:hypothetical protein